mmetsp:Transcript_16046/g.15765  ORF Transcript_16046/g.15765 Transcript_16046/m.15765 type:complete len:142 (-) Transcript_16046:263-688(-)
MILNSIRRGKEIIMQTTSEDDKTFHKVRNLMNRRSKAKISKLKKTIKKSAHLDMGDLEMVKFPSYFKHVANKYLSSEFKSATIDKSRLDSVISRRSGMTKNQSKLPMIRSTGQGIKAEPKVRTVFSEIRTVENSWKTLKLK